MRECKSIYVEYRSLICQLSAKLGYYRGLRGGLQFMIDYDYEMNKEDKLKTKGKIEALEEVIKSLEEIIESHYPNNSNG